VPNELYFQIDYNVLLIIGVGDLRIKQGGEGGGLGYLLVRYLLRLGMGLLTLLLYRSELSDGTADLRVTNECM